jgi:hypothetical protein
MASACPVPATNGRESATSPPGPQDNVRLLSQMLLTCAASSLRYWGRSAELWGKAVPLIVDMLVLNGRLRDDGEAMARRLDEIRAELREFLELPAQEARRLQAELERIVLGRARDTAPGPPPDAAEPYWRRWETKP